MNESRAGVITYSSPTQRQRRIAQRKRIDPRNANINGLRPRVLAVLRHPRRTGAKKLIAPRGPVSANDLDLRVRMPDRRGHIGKNVEHSRIIVFDVACTMIAQEMIQLFFSFRKVDIAATVHNVNVLACMRMIKAEMMFLRRSGFGGEGGIAGGDNPQNQKSATERKCDDCLQQAKPPTRIPSNEKKIVCKQQFYLKKG